MIRRLYRSCRDNWAEARRAVKRRFNRTGDGQPLTQRKTSRSGSIVVVRMQRLGPNSPGSVPQQPLSAAGNGVQTLFFVFGSDELGASYGDTGDPSNAVPREKLWFLCSSSPNRRAMQIPRKASASSPLAYPLTAFPPIGRALGDSLAAAFCRDEALANQSTSGIPPLPSRAFGIQSCMFWNGHAREQLPAPRSGGITRQRLGTESRQRRGVHYGLPFGTQVKSTQAGNGMCRKCTGRAHPRNKLRFAESFSR